VDCKLSDLRYMEDVRTLWFVDSEGEPEFVSGTSEEGEFRGYICGKCFEEFDSWDDAKEHVA
jgi:hypothetical protein